MEDKKFQYHGAEVVILLFDENFYPYEAWADGYSFVGSFLTQEEAEKQAKWHIDHMI